jgi:predicted aspartyl protease
VRRGMIIIILGVAFAARAAIFMYVDDAGKRHVVGDINAVPPEYRNQIETVEGAYDDSTPEERDAARREAARRREAWLRGQSTRIQREKADAAARKEAEEQRRRDAERAAGGEVKVLLFRNRVYVPVTLQYDQRRTDAYLVLDTGAERTVIHADVAQRIGIKFNTLDRGSAYGVGGVEVECRYFKLGRLEVGPYAKETFHVGVVEYGGPRTTAKGLLGMDFLKGYEHEVDYAAGVVRLKPR